MHLDNNLPFCSGQCHFLCYKLNNFVRKASSMVGMELNSVKVVIERMNRGKLKAIMHNLSHPLYTELRKLRSTCSHRLIQPRASKGLGSLFIPSASKLHNVTASNPPCTTHSTY